jgi:uncharacterized protein YebE (UPF0316 family)
MFDVYAWVFIPLLIFFARVLDVSIGTVKLIMIGRGHRGWAPFLSFVEVLVWITALAEIIKNLTNPVNYVAYAGGFAFGTYVGMWLDERLKLGNIMVTIITRQDCELMLERLKLFKFPYTHLNASGEDGPVSMIFSIIRRKRLNRFLGLIHEVDPKAFYMLEDVRHVSYPLTIPPEECSPGLSQHLRRVRRK